jgi:hypothetical protein
MFLTPDTYFRVFLASFPVCSNFVHLVDGSGASRRDVQRPGASLAAPENVSLGAASDEASGTGSVPKDLAVGLSKPVDLTEEAS